MVLYTGRTMTMSRRSRENYFLAIKKLVEGYSVKLDYDINILSAKSYKELKQMYRELQIQLGMRKGQPMPFGQLNYGNVMVSRQRGRLCSSLEIAE